jgi:hypothetical protein
MAALNERGERDGSERDKRNRINDLRNAERIARRGDPGKVRENPDSSDETRRASASRPPAPGIDPGTMAADPHRHVGAKF